MRVHVAQQLTDYEGRKLVDGKDPVTFRRVFATALNASDEKDRPGPEKMAQIYALSVKLYSGEEIELTLEEATLIKEQVGKVYNPLVYGRTVDLLEGKTAKKK
jgi:hypothetical protein